MAYRNLVTGEISNKDEIPVKPYRAKYTGTCTKCSKPIEIGHVIVWPKTGGNRGRYHQWCEQPRLSPWELISKEQKQAPKYESSYECSKCGATYPSPDLLDLHISKVHDHGQEQEEQEQFEGDKQYDMQIPEELEEYEKQDPKKIMQQAPKQGDGLLDLISSQVEAKVIESVRRKVQASIDTIDRNVKEKLDKISIPSIEIKRPDLPTIKIHNVHKQFSEVLEYLNAGSYVYLHGSPGGHKSSIGPQLAEALGVRYGFMSLCEQTPEYVVRGCVLVNGDFYKPPFLDFLRNGGVWCWEELDSANDNLRTSLNTVLENKLVCLDNGESFKISDKFYLIGNGNTCGRGAHPAFPSRTAFDAAFAARFEYVEFEYDWELCKHIALGINKHAGPIVTWAEKVCNWALANGVQLVMSPREVYKLSKLHVLTKVSASKLLDSTLKGLDIPSKEKMLANYPFPSITRE